MTIGGRPIVSSAPLRCNGFERLTVGTATGGTTFGSVPAAGADAILMQVEAADVRLRMDGGTPTPTLGHLLEAANEPVLWARLGTIGDYRFIAATGAAGTISAHFYEVR